MCSNYINLTKDVTMIEMEDIMGILNSEVNYDQVVSDLGKCCLGTDSCGVCKQEACIIGYGKKCITGCFKEGVTYVEDGGENIPIDTKIFHEEVLSKGIAHILKQCKSCSENHFENCIINVIRNCYEVAIFGELQPYEGSAFRYLNQIHNSNPEIAGVIIEHFHESDDE